MEKYSLKNSNNDLANKLGNDYKSNSNIGKGIIFGKNADGSKFTLRPVLGQNLFQLTKNDTNALLNIDTNGNLSVAGELNGASLNAPHTHSFADLHCGYTSEAISGYSGFRIKRTTADGLKEEIGRIAFSKIGFSQQFGYLYYNTAQPYTIPLGYTYSTIYDIRLQPMSAGALLGTTVSSWDNSHIKYWLYCGKAGSFDLELAYHVIGR